MKMKSRVAAARARQAPRIAHPEDGSESPAPVDVRKSAAAPRAKHTINRPSPVPPRLWRAPDTPAKPLARPLPPSPAGGTLAPPADHKNHKQRSRGQIRERQDPRHEAEPALRRFDEHLGPKLLLEGPQNLLLALPLIEARADFPQHPFRRVARAGERPARVITAARRLIAAAAHAFQFRAKLMRAVIRLLSENRDHHDRRGCQGQQPHRRQDWTNFSHALLATPRSAAPAPAR